MFSSSRFNQAKSETTSRLCVQRIKLIRNKKTVLLKQSQRDIAELLRSGKQEYARIRVEGVIREKLLMQAYEILELYLELLTQRTQLIAKTKELPRDMMEAVSSIIYAAQRINDLPELATLKTLFAGKYGKEYAAEAAADATASRWQVNDRLIRCLLVEAPQPEEKLQMLSEIAQEHGVEWDLAAAARDMGVGGVGTVGTVGTGGGGPVAGQLPPHGADGGTAAPVAAAIGVPGAAGTYPSVAPAAAPMGPVQLGSAQYTSAQQAAVAAAAAAAQANAAAQYAAQVAAAAMAGAAHGGMHFAAAGGNGAAAAAAQGWQPPPASAAVVSDVMAMYGTAAAPPPPPPSMFSAVVARSAPSPPPLLHPDGDAAAAAPPPLSVAGNGGAASAVSSVGGYLVRSDSELQRAYDAAQGPPTKAEIAAAPTPAPPPAAAAPAPAPAPSPPSPPPEKQQPSAPPPPPEDIDEYELLMKRLETLKNS